MQPRRQQPPITFRSARAAQLLARHTATGKSQAQVIEEALERLPAPAMHEDEEAAFEERMARLDALLEHVTPTPPGTMALFDYEEYDSDGLPR